jgi:hypothetical protein
MKDLICIGFEHAVGASTGAKRWSRYRVYWKPPISEGKHFSTILLTRKRNVLDSMQAYDLSKQKGEAVFINRLKQVRQTHVKIFLC